MPDRPLDYSTPRPDAPKSKQHPQYLDINLGRGRRWKGFAGYVLLFMAVAIVLVWMFTWFTSSLWLAAGVVLFLVGYMLLMGFWAGRNIEGRD